MADEKKIGEAEFPDIAAWGEKDVSGAYAPGTKVMIGGEEVDLSAVPDLIGGAAAPSPKGGK